MEAIRTVQREFKRLNNCESYGGIVEINLDFDRRQIEIRDNGRGMTDGDVRNAVNYGRLKNRIATGCEIVEKVKAGLQTV